MPSLPSFFRLAVKIAGASLAPAGLADSAGIYTNPAWGEHLRGKTVIDLYSDNVVAQKEKPPLSTQRKKELKPGIPPTLQLLFSRLKVLFRLEGFTIHTLLYGRIGFMSPNLDAVKGTIVFRIAMVLALLHAALNRLVFIHFLLLLWRFRIRIRRK